MRAEPQRRLLLSVQYSTANVQQEAHSEVKATPNSPGSHICTTLLRYKTQNAHTHTHTHTHTCEPNRQEDQVVVLLIQLILTTKS